MTKTEANKFTGCRNWHQSQSVISSMLSKIKWNDGEGRCYEYQGINGCLKSLQLLWIGDNINGSVPVRIVRIPLAIALKSQNGNFSKMEFERIL